MSYCAVQHFFSLFLLNEALLVENNDIGHGNDHLALSKEKRRKKKRGEKYRYENMKQLEKRKIVENERTDS